MLAKNLLLAGIAAISLAKVTAQDGGIYRDRYNVTPPWDKITDQNFLGSPMLLNDWTTGKIVTEQGKEIADASLLFNYNKVSRELNVTMDKKSFFQIDGKAIKSFTLHTTEGDVFFCKMPQINKNRLFQLVATGKNFNVYKSITVVIRDNSAYEDMHGAGYYYHSVVYTSPSANVQPGQPRANVLNSNLDYKTGPNDSLIVREPNATVYNYAGINASGNNKIKRYDDVAEYYIVENSGAGLLTAKFHLTKTSISDAFRYYSADKADQYMKEHYNTLIDEDFVKNIADYFNQ